MCYKGGRELLSAEILWLANIRIRIYLLFKTATGLLISHNYSVKVVRGGDATHSGKDDQLF